MNNKILVLAPTTHEAVGFKRAIRSKGKCNNKYYVAYTGYGKAYAAGETGMQLASRQYDFVVLIGFVESSKDFAVGEVVMPNVVRYNGKCLTEGLAAIFKDYMLEGNDDVPLYTVEEGLQFCESGLDRHVLLDREAVAVAQICEEYKVPLLVMKIVGDNTGNEKTLLEFSTSFKYYDKFFAFLEML